MKLNYTPSIIVKTVKKLREDAAKLAEVSNVSLIPQAASLDRERRIILATLEAIYKEYGVNYFD